MTAFLHLNKKPIQYIFLLMLLVFGGLTLLISGFVYITQRNVFVFYSLLFIVGLSAFCVLAMILLEYVRSIQEVRFFKRPPFDIIEKKQTATDFIQNSKYSFFRKHRIFEIDGFKYEAVLYPDFVKNELGNVLVILKEIHTEERSVFHIIDYKNKTLPFDEASLIDELKKIY